MAREIFSAQEAQTCEACGARFYFVQNEETGKWLPVNLVRVVYAVGTGLIARKVSLPPPPQAGSYVVSHFETCSDPQRFSRQAGRGMRES